MVQKCLGIFQYLHAHKQDKKAGDEERDAKWKERNVVSNGGLRYNMKDVSKWVAWNRKPGPPPDDDVDGAGGAATFQERPDGQPGFDILNFVKSEVGQVGGTGATGRSQLHKNISQ